MSYPSDISQAPDSGNAVRNQERLDKAIALATRGLPNEGIALLRPLVAEKGKWPGALAAMGFCFEKSGNLPTAIYLYKQALVQQPQSKDWLELLANAEKKSAERLEAARKTKPSSRPVVQTFLLASFAALLVLSVAVTELSDFIDLTTGVRPIAYLPWVLAAAGALILFALWTMVSWIIKRLRHSKVMWTFKTEDLSDGPVVCRTCGLNYRKGPLLCPFCGTPRVAPKEPKAPKSVAVPSRPPLPSANPDEPPPLPGVSTLSSNRQEDPTAQSPPPLPMTTGGGTSSDAPPPVPVSSPQPVRPETVLSRLAPWQGQPLVWILGAVIALLVFFVVGYFVLRKATVEYRRYHPVPVPTGSARASTVQSSSAAISLTDLIQTRQRISDVFDQWSGEIGQARGQTAGNELASQKEIPKVHHRNVKLLADELEKLNGQKIQWRFTINVVSEHSVSFLEAPNMGYAWASDSRNPFFIWFGDQTKVIGNVPGYLDIDKNLSRSDAEQLRPGDVLVIKGNVNVFVADLWRKNYFHDLRTLGNTENVESPFPDIQIQVLISNVQVVRTERRGNR